MPAKLSMNSFYLSYLPSTILLISIYNIYTNDSNFAVFKS